MNVKFGTAWLVLVLGVFAAVLINAKGCGPWGVSCALYAFLTFIGAAIISAALFWSSVPTLVKHGLAWYVAVLMGALTLLAVLASLFAVGITLFS